MIPETERTDFKSAAEQQVRETLGWEIRYYEMMVAPAKVLYRGHPMNPIRIATADDIQTWDALVSKTAELMEMTAQRDELDRYRREWKLLLHEISKAFAVLDSEWEDAGLADMDEFDPWDALRRIQKAMLQSRDNFDARSSEWLAEKSRAESAEATIREQAERIKELEKERFLYCPKCLTQIRINL